MAEVAGSAKVNPLPSIRIALAQMRVDPGCPDLNLSRAEQRIDEAAEAGARIVLLPEALDLGWTHPSARADAQPIPSGAPFHRLAAAARRCGVHVAAGLTERCGDRIYNAAVLIGPDGGILLHHRKINELGIGHDCYDPGDRLGVVRLPFATVGLMICADGFAQDEILSRSLGAMGADLILSPCAWAVPADHDPVREPYGGLWEACHGRVAHDFGLIVAAASCVGPIPAGPWAGRRCIGNSLVTAPEGTTLRGPYGEEALLTIDLKMATGRPRFSTER